MLFNSFQFIFLFLPLAFAGYFATNKFVSVNVGKLCLILASFVFYGYWNIKYVPLLLVSIFVNYILGAAMSDGDRPFCRRARNWIKSCLTRKQILVLGLGFNVSLLAYFKYANFFVENINLASNLQIPLPNVVLPLAISFFTFQKIAYLVDCYSRKSTDYGLLDYTLFVMFFPQLIAGPIVHHSEIVPQFESRHSFYPRRKNIVLGILVFSVGLFKKAIVADTFSVWASHGFDQRVDLSTLDAWITSLSYTFQLYFDFSGYTDMAIGAALLFNIRLPENFNSPYKAISIQDFWRRWHMTLSRFLRDYIYIPLGGSRRGEIRTYSALFLTFLLGGLWHGASWMFVIWGALHGTALIVHRIWANYCHPMPKFLAWFVTFNFVNFGWVFFRAKDLESAFRVIVGMSGWNDIGVHLLWLYNFAVSNSYVLALFVAFAIILLGKPTKELFRGPKIQWWVALFVGGMTGVVALTALSMATRPSEFLYFNF